MWFFPPFLNIPWSGRISGPPVERLFHRLDGIETMSLISFLLLQSGFCQSPVESPTLRATLSERAGRNIFPPPPIGPVICSQVAGPIFF